MLQYWVYSVSPLTLHLGIWALHLDEAQFINVATNNCFHFVKENNKDLCSYFACKSYITANCLI